jgi:hypothetical protein
LRAQSHSIDEHQTREISPAGKTNTGRDSALPRKIRTFAGTRHLPGPCQVGVEVFLDLSLVVFADTGLGDMVHDGNELRQHPFGDPAFVNAFAFQKFDEICFRPG